MSETTAATTATTAPKRRPRKQRRSLLLLSERDLETDYGIAPKTAQSWRSRGGGPPFIKLGDRPKSPVRYRRAAVEAWLTAREHTSTADPGGNGSSEGR